MAPIFLMGFMGSGKSTLGRELHRLTGVTFIDLDDLIEQRYGMKIRDMFAAVGESEFRRRETETLKTTATMSDTVVALGGGTPCHGDNMEWILAHGTSVFLTTSKEKIYQRLLHGRYKRPLIANLDDDALLTYIRDTIATRMPYYSRATARFNADGLDPGPEREATVMRFARLFGITTDKTTNQP